MFSLSLLAATGALTVFFGTRETVVAKPTIFVGMSEACADAGICKDDTYESEKTKVMKAEICASMGLCDRGNQLAAIDMRVAIAGEGYFAVRRRTEDTDSYAFVRDAYLQVNAQGQLQTADGSILQGYAYEGPNVFAPRVSDIRLPRTSPLPPKATSKVLLHVDLSSKLADGEPATFVDYLSGEETACRAVTCFDADGSEHNIGVTFIKRDKSSYRYRATIEGGYVKGRLSDQALEIASGVLHFDAEGDLTRVEQRPVPVQLMPGAHPQVIDIEFDMGVKGTWQSTLGAQQARVSPLAQDGYLAGQLMHVWAEGEGRLWGLYNNGDRRTLAKVAVASLSDDGAANATELGSLATESLTIVYGPPGEGGRGIMLSSPGVAEVFSRRDPM